MGGDDVAYDNLSEILMNKVSKYCGEHPENNKPMPMYRVAAAIGVSRETLSAWMNGTAMPSFANAIAMADVLGVSVDELAGRTS